jgi:hypothetical protein
LRIRQQIDLKGKLIHGIEASYFSRRSLAFSGLPGLHGGEQGPAQFPVGNWSGIGLA